MCKTWLKWLMIANAECLITRSCVFIWMRLTENTIADLIRKFHYEVFLTHNARITQDKGFVSGYIKIWFFFEALIFQADFYICCLKCLCRMSIFSPAMNTIVVYLDVQSSHKGRKIAKYRCHKLWGLSVVKQLNEKENKIFFKFNAIPAFNCFTTDTPHSLWQLYFAIILLS